MKRANVFEGFGLSNAVFRCVTIYDGDMNHLSLVSLDSLLCPLVWAERLFVYPHRAIPYPSMASHQALGPGGVVVTPCIMYTVDAHDLLLFSPVFVVRVRVSARPRMGLDVSSLHVAKVQVILDELDNGCYVLEPALFDCGKMTLHIALPFSIVPLPRTQTPAFSRVRDQRFTLAD